MMSLVWKICDALDRYCSWVCGTTHTVGGSYLILAIPFYLIVVVVLTFLGPITQILTHEFKED